MLERWRTAWLRETYALPLDVFRVLASLLCVPYFVRLMLEVPDFAAADGFLDHSLIRRIFWFTTVSLFQPGMGTAWMYAALVLALLATLGILVGYRVRWCAAIAWLIAVSHFRWNFLVIDLDDTGIQFLLFWLMLLPVGHTLTWADYRRSKRLGTTAELWREWSHKRVPGAVLQCFYANLYLYYLVAGLTKLESPLWRQGYALYVSLRLPLTWVPEFWGPQHLQLLRFLNYATLVVEPLFPFILLLPRSHPLKWAGLVGLAIFHCGIILTMGIVYANAALLISMTLVFKDEIMAAVRRRLDTASVPPEGVKRLGGAAKFAAVFVVLVAVSMSREVPFSGELYEVGFGLQWMVGMAQEYHVFNWIDKYNYRVVNEVRFTAPQGPSRTVDPSWLFPRSDRATLMQAYIHYIRWQTFPDCMGGELRRALLLRAAQRYARLHAAAGRVDVFSTLWRMGVNAGQDERREGALLMSFDIVDGQAVMRAY